MINHDIWYRRASSKMHWLTAFSSLKLHDNARHEPLLILSQHKQHQSPGIFLYTNIQPWLTHVMYQIKHFHQPRLVIQDTLCIYFGPKYHDIGYGRGNTNAECRSNYQHPNVHISSPLAINGVMFGSMSVLLEHDLWKSNYWYGYLSLFYWWWTAKKKKKLRKFISIQ